jgi:hypothetical protein
VLHEAGYDYEDIPKLTAAETRRLMEGRRVDAEIREKMREIERNDGDGGGAAQGRVVPRESDEELLDDYADRLDGVNEPAVGRGT